MCGVCVCIIESNTHDISKVTLLLLGFSEKKCLHIINMIISDFRRVKVTLA